MFLRFVRYNSRRSFLAWRWPQKKQEMACNTPLFSAIHEDVLNHVILQNEYRPI